MKITPNENHAKAIAEDSKNWVQGGESQAALEAAGRAVFEEGIRTAIKHCFESFSVSSRWWGENTKKPNLNIWPFEIDNGAFLEIEFQDVLNSFIENIKYDHASDADIEGLALSLERFAAELRTHKKV